MDSMRGILMMLGLVYHSAKLFSPKQDWILFTNNTTDIAYYIVEIIHLFRMPTFFIVSGYFAAMTLKKYGVRKFLKVRVSRILIPLITTALTLNSLQAWILTKSGWMDMTLSAYLREGGWVTHLWFLINLLLYFILAALFVLLFKKKFFNLLRQIDTLLLKVPFAFILLFLLPSSIILFLAIGQVYPIRAIINTSLIFNYMPFFFFGMLLFSHQKLLQKFTEFPPKMSALVTIVTLLIVNYLYQFEAYSWYIIRTMILSIGMWASASLCFFLFKKYTDYHSKVFRFLSEISYSVYLFHHGLVIAFGLLLLHFQIGGFLGMLLLIVIVATTSIMIHTQLIAKVPLLSLFFNGKISTKAKP
jgi:glucan biosynthesis protein C